MCVYVLILLVLIFGIRRVYINHCTVVFGQFNVLMKSQQVSVQKRLNLRSFQPYKQHNNYKGTVAIELHRVILSNQHKKSLPSLI